MAPFRLDTLGTAANAATTRPMNSGLSELLRSKDLAASTASVRTRPGESDTAVTPCDLNSCAMSDVILSVAAFAIPFTVLPRYFRAAQNEMLTMSPRRAGTIVRAACWLATKAVLTPTVSIASQRHDGCCQNGSMYVNWPSSTMRS